MENPNKFDERWDNYVMFMETARKLMKEPSDAYDKEVIEHFFNLLRGPKNVLKTITLAHGVKALRESGCSSQRTAFALFVFFIYGSVMANGGEFPNLDFRDLQDKEPSPNDMN